MLPVCIYLRSLRRPPAAADLISHIAKIGKNIVIVFVTRAAGDLQLRIDLPDESRTLELRNQRGLVGEFDAGSTVFGRPSPRCRIL